MSQRCHLTIYEPDKDPRVVELPINRSNSKGNEKCVYNEDGTVLEDYQLYLETAEGEFIKVPCSNDKPKEKWNALKSWRKSVGTSDDVHAPQNHPSSSTVSDIPVSERARDFLSTCMVYSIRNEKKIARKKQLRNTIADKKLKNKLKKQRKK